jgi:hypothetical protein
MKKLSWLFLTACVCILLISIENIFAASVFDLLVTSEGEKYEESYNEIKDLVDAIDEDYIRQNIPNYTDVSEAFGKVNFRGVSIELGFKKESTELALDIPAIGVKEIFVGSTRDDSVDKLEEWFKNSGGEALTKLMQELVASTPNDPIAGNPNSLMANIVQLDYDAAFTANNSNIRQVSEIETDKTVNNSNLIGIGARFGSYRQGDMDSQHISFPLSYTVRFDNSSNKLRFKLPITMTEVDGAKAYNLGFGIGFGWQLVDNWEITPSVNYAAVASVDLGSVGQIASGSVTSAYKFGIGNCELSIGNMIGYYKTLEFSYDDYSLNPDIANTVIRNGIMLSIPTQNILQRTAIELFINDTRYFGSNLYIDQYNEIGFSFGYTKTERKTVLSKIKNYFRDFRIGVTYLYSDNSKGFSANIGYKF